MRNIATSFLVCLFVSASVAQEATTPKLGSPLRKSILDAVRVLVEKSLHGQKVIFVVNNLKATADWAFVFGAPKAANGKSLDYKNSEFKDAFESGAFDENFGALLKRKGGKWTVVTWFFGATDVPWVDWPQKYKAPKSIFPKMGN